MPTEIDLKQHFPLVWSIARRFASCRGESCSDDSDAYAEGLLLLVKASHAYDPERGTFATFATACVVNGLAKWSKLRRNSACVQIPERYEVTCGSGNEESNRHARSARLCEIAGGLPESRFRSMLLLRLDGLGWQEIGDRFGISKQAAEQSFQRGMPALLERVPCSL